MTTQYAILKGLPAGLTFTSAKLFTIAAPDTEVAGNMFSFANRTNATSQYVVTIARLTALPAGDYTLIAYLATGPRAELQCTFAGTNGETATETPEVAELDTATLAKIDSILEDTGTTLPAQISGISGGGAGTGARTVTITINDGTTVLQNATVRMTEGVNSYTALTDASGVAVFNLDDATYVVSIYKSGYSYSGTTMVVDGTEAATYSMTEIAITPGADNLTTGWLVTRVAGVATEGITIRYQQAQEPDSDTGSSYDATIYNVESDEDGVAAMPMVIGGYYYVWRGTGKRPDSAQLIEIPADSYATYELPSHVGR